MKHTHLYLFTLIFLWHQSAGMTTPNVYVTSGINLAFSQEVLNKVVPILHSLMEGLAEDELNLYFPNILKIKGVD